MNDTKQPVSEKSPEYLAATLREVAETLDDVGKTIDARLGAWAATPSEPEPEPPRPEEEPKTVSIPTLGNFTVKFAAITSITAAWDDGRACLRVVGDGNSMTHVFTTTPLADIRKQAAEAGIELPEVTVNIDSYRWTAIERADCHVCDDGSLLTGIIGVAERYGEHTIHTSTLTPAQVVVLCELAGWPKPEVTMVCTYADGDPCEVDPENIFGVGVARHATTIETNTPLADGRCVHHVREPVAVVEAMIDVCQEGE